AGPVSRARLDSGGLERALSLAAQPSPSVHAEFDRLEGPAHLHEFVRFVEDDHFAVHDRAARQGELGVFAPGRRGVRARPVGPPIQVADRALDDDFRLAARQHSLAIAAPFPERAAPRLGVLRAGVLVRLVQAAARVRIAVATAVVRAAAEHGPIPAGPVALERFFDLLKVLTRRGQHDDRRAARIHGGAEVADRLATAARAFEPNAMVLRTLDDRQDGLAVGQLIRAPAAGGVGLDPGVASFGCHVFRFSMLPPAGQGGWAFLPRAERRLP